MNLILASASPRRKELLGLITQDFSIQVSQVEEVVNSQKPEDVVQELALLKARDIARKNPDALVLGADTLVYLNGRPMGKPADRDQAYEMIKALSGNTHQVYTGVAFVHQASGRTETAFDCTDVIFDPLSEEEIQAYISTNEPYDKAGAYAVQGYASRFIPAIKGCYFNVMGLPVRLVYQMLKKLDPK